MLAVAQLTCQRGARTLFSGLSFTLPERQWIQIQGANGAGKTTLLRVLAGLVQPQEGTLTWQGLAVQECRAEWQRALLYLGHHAALKEELTPLENLRFSLGLEAMPADEAVLMNALHRFGLQEREHLPVRYLSAGQRRRVLLARLLIRPAQVWILDEPYTALDVHATQFLSAVIEDHLEQGGSAILTSHQTLGLRPGMSIAL
ncbi:cytochrome c biogenesis heme-transporting ATPase CcmA [Ferrovum sp.]|uniref:cytochrome c biogenesis heme-transporting ATPase CcmA n=1 Tax=Ferrovum sp. TaxID=2609467 RepID=UPI0026209F7A|nr:cytochrome c biogenesis heme-transporting ATPase CcmA [Ferrovum sp.]